MKKYEEYKESGVEWVRRIPSKWNKRKLKFTALGKDCCFIDGDWIESKNISEEGIRYLTSGNVGALHYKEQGSGYITEETFKELDCKDVYEGDILISRLNEPISRACIVPNLNNRIVTCVDNVIYRPNTSEFNKKYIVYVLNCAPYTEKANLTARGVTMHRISRTMLGNFYIPVPSLSEQQSIASFLDAKTNSIDAIISKREKQIELLEEMKSAIISRAVTKGLNPNAKMKDSRVEWIGEVPSHWDAIRLKFCGTIKSGDFLSKDNISDIGSVEVYGGNGFIGYTSRSNITPPAIIIGRVGALCGNVRLVTSEKWVSDNALVLHIQHKLIYQYTSLILQAVNLNRLNTSSAQPLITGSKIMNVFVPVPPLSEQHAIASYLDAETSKIDARIAKRRRQIALLQEYKQALITDAVTGKIDVREFNS